MKKILYILTLAVVGITMYSCTDDYETYEEKRDYERSAISRFIDNPTQGEIKGKKINVISEEEFLKDTITDLSKNEFVHFSNGVYMQIVRRGCGGILKNGESATMICRFKEYNLNTTDDTKRLSLMNDAPNTDQQYYEKIDVLNNSGTFIASWCVKEDKTEYHGTMPNKYYSTDRNGNFLSPTVVPQGWCVPLSYIKLGRPVNENEEIAKVRLIVPHDMGHLIASSSDNIYAYYYEITYERGV